MAIIKGSMNYTPSGRKRKRLKKSRKTYTPAKHTKSSPAHLDRLERMKAFEKAYPSLDTQTKKDFKPTARRCCPAGCGYCPKNWSVGDPLLAAYSKAGRGGYRPKACGVA